MTPSGSRTNLLLDCQFWAREGINAPPEDPSEFSEYGTCVHTCAELLKLGKQPDLQELQVLHSLSDYDRDQALIDAQALVDWVNENVPGQFHTERAYAFNTADFTARVMESNGHRDYSSKLPTEYCGTLDLVAIQGDTATVVDYKTGRQPPESYQGQLEFGALCVLLAVAGIKRLRCVVLKVDDGQCYPFQWEVDASDLDDVGMQIQAAFQLIPTAEPQPGPHCLEKHCPLAGTCPATVGRLLPVMKELHPEKLETITPEDIPTDMTIRDLPQALRLYRFYRLASRMLEAVEAGLQRYADANGGIPVSHSTVYQADDRTRWYYRLTDKARELLQKELGPKFAAIEANISKQSLKKAFGSGARLDAALEKLQAIGAAKPSAYVTYVERKAS